MLNVERQFKLCDSPDEDPLDLCEPVNCHVKYRGFRSLFDPDKRQCVAIPVCDSGGPNSSKTVVTKCQYNNYFFGFFFSRFTTRKIIGQRALLFREHFHRKPNNSHIRFLFFLGGGEGVVFYYSSSTVHAIY